MINDDHFKVAIHPDRVPRGQYESRFNAPTTNEIAAVIVVNKLCLGTLLYRRMMAFSLGFPKHTYYMTHLSTQLFFAKDKRGTLLTFLT
ncbi:unnamed protein product [Euphydryas editha]|uniref:Uncharacterized protein n=1 Tax=Euphydryas editha TaxID=104508 RepID=A0AAU9UVD1_EUPED|nr:unnamed protein product [Euphydryas editha]